MLNKLKKLIVNKYPQLGKYIRAEFNDGFIEELPQPEHYQHLGGQVIKDVLVEDGDWTKYRPIGELQKRSGSETMACVTFSAMNCLESIINRHVEFVENGKATKEEIEIVKIFEGFGLIKEGKSNFSDRYIAKLSNTTTDGNSQHKVAETIREFGLIPEEDWPYVEGWGNYYKSVPQELIDKGKRLAKLIVINNEWINPVNFVSEKRYAPIQTSCFAWGSQINGIYQRTYQRKNHAIDHDYDSPTSKDIFDSYEPFNKQLSPNFNLGWGKLFSVHLKEKEYNTKEIEKLVERGIKYIQRPLSHGEVYEIINNKLVFRTKSEVTKLGIKSLRDDNELIGINEDFYDSLLI